ncbi:MAG: phosphoethanolamine--lipid A transferase [Cellvibrio sp.]|uniref:phosphoethanolamine transferase n=1 Tax=Cellvibrio sp. TaxID=1965322 RepID=UPI0031A06929
MSLSILMSARSVRIGTGVSSIQAAWISALCFIAFYNTSFFGAIFHLIDYGSLRGIIFIINLSIVLWLLTFIVISLITFPYVFKPVLSVLLITSAGVSYFMGTYGVVIHRMMIQSVAETDFSESLDLLSLRLVLYFLVLGIFPSLLLFNVRISYEKLKVEIWRKLKFIVVAFVSCLILILSMSMDYASFFRNHKNIRQMANPLNFIYAGLSYATTNNRVLEIKPIGVDVTLSPLGKAQEKPTLLILVVGETARADHFGINGYGRDTTPLIAQQHIVNFPSVISCGTETAVSVPCMFSALGHDNYSDTKAKSQEGLLDVIKRAGIEVLWRDNNSSCKGTCAQVTYEDVQHLQVPLLCNSEECFDEILLHQLGDKVASSAASQVIVLHQKGSHGPDYYKRYPHDKTFFSPVCTTNQLQNCTHEEVVNAYDNTIRYTDYFLNKTIEWLKERGDKYNTALIYLSDHGESLGESGLYLHGMPYSIAPKEQTQIPLFMWLSAAYQTENHIDRPCLERVGAGNTYSHDYFFHTILSMLNLQTDIYNPELDIVRSCRKAT